MIKENLEDYKYQYFDIDQMHRQAVKLWQESIEGARKVKIRGFNQTEKNENEQALLELIQKIEESKTKEKLKSVLQAFLLQGPIFSREGKEIFMDPGFFISSEAFINKVRNYDPGINKEDIGQAFRNVWIMNLLQKTFDIPLICTDGVFGYSMLYPYTDNFMDDPGVKKEEKYLAGKRLHQRLLGSKEKAKGENEEKVFDMIEKIEGAFSRKEYPEVFDSLLYIHHSQQESLRQHISDISDQRAENSRRPEPKDKLQEKRLLEISFHKGGASVLADGYLVKGKLNQEERIFCFNYGALLQMADDLQDCKEDYENQHQTLFSMEYGKKTLDNKAHQLIRFAENVFEIYFSDKNSKGMKKFLMENTLLLILGSVLMNPSCFSSEYVLWAERHFPVSRKFLERQQREIKEKLIKQEPRGLKESLKVW